MTIVAFILLGLAAVLWFGMLGDATTMRRSDHATRGLSELLAMALAVLVWILLAVVLLVGGARTPMPGGLTAAAILLVPASGASAIAAIRVLAWDGARHLRWVVLTPAAAPLLMAGQAVCMLVPDLFAGMAGFAGVVWGGVAAVSVLPWIALAIGRRVPAG